MTEMDDLPIDILREILLLLPWEDAAHMTVLSQTWHALWGDFRVYNDFDFEQRPNQTFWDFIDMVDQRMLELRSEKGIIPKFRLRIIYDGMGSHINDWIELVAKNCVREIDLHITPSIPGVWYPLNPKTFLSAKPLQVLRLQRCKLEKPSFADTRNFSHLREVSLVEVVLDDEVLHDFLIGCPLLVDLALAHCTGLNILVIPACLQQLQSLGVCCPRIRIKGIIIESGNLQSFHYFTRRYEKLPRICFPGYLTTLNIDNTHITDDLFQHIISILPLLRTLKLKSCIGMHTVKISHQSLQTLSLVLGWGLSILEIEIPSLLSFEYGSDIVPHDFSINAPSLQESYLRIEIKFPIWIDIHWFHTLRVYLSKFNQQPTMVIKFHMNAPVVSTSFITGELDDHAIEMLPAVCVVQQLEMQIATHLSQIARFPDGLLWCCHPAEILVHGNTRFIRFLWKRLLVDRVKDPLCRNDRRIRCWRDPLCCIDSRIRCWRHNVRDVSIKGLTNARERNDYLSSLPYKRINPPQNICFQLKWEI